MPTIFQDVRYAFRMFFRSTGFSATAILLIALGVGATTAIFGIINALLLRPFAAPASERLVDVVDVSGGRQHVSFTYPVYEDMKTAGGMELAAWRSDRLNLRKDYVGPIAAVIASGNYFDVLHARPSRGRYFTPADDRSNPYVVVLSHEGWRRHFGEDPDLIGKAITLNGVAMTVIGITPPGFTGATVAVAPDVWVPAGAAPLLKNNPSLLTDRLRRSFSLLARLGAETELRSASAELTAGVNRVPYDPASPERSAIVLYPTTGIPVDQRATIVQFLSMLLAAAGLLLLIACVNVGGLLLARATTRQKEIAIRLAIGASRGRMVQQLLSESAMLFAVGGLAGILLSRWITDFLISLPLPVSGSIVLDAPVDARVLVFAFGISLLASVAFGLVPAFGAVRGNAVAALKGLASERRQSRARSVFIVCQFAMSLVLVISAGLFVSSVQRASTLDPGYEPDGLVVATFDFTVNGYTSERGMARLDRVRRELDARPDVAATALSHSIPLGRTNWSFGPLAVPGEPKPIRANMNWVDPQYFRTTETPIIRGRSFTEADSAASEPAAIVSESTARRLWQSVDGIGRTITFDGKQLLVVGIAGNVHDRTLGETTELYVYRPIAQTTPGVVSLIVRARRDDGAILGALRQTVGTIDPAEPLVSATVLRDTISAVFAPQRVAAAITTACGIVGLLLSAVGLYGVVRFSVAQRQRELAIRIALGARAEQLVYLVLRRALALVAVGTVVGILAAAALGRVTATFLFGISATDPLVTAGAIALLAAVAVLASYLPARRGMVTDPAAAMRSET